MGEQDWCLEGLNYSIWGNTFKSSGSSRGGTWWAGCSSMGRLLCYSLGWSNDPAPVWPTHVHPGLINTALTQLLCSPGRLGNALCLCECGSKGPGGCWCRQSQTESGLDCQDQGTALIYLPFCLYTVSKLPAFHCGLSLVCPPTNCGISNISL